MASKKKAAERRDIINNPSLPPPLRDYLQRLNTKSVVWGTTTTTTSTTTTTTT